MLEISAVLREGKLLSGTVSPAPQQEQVNLAAAPQEAAADGWDQAAQTDSADWWDRVAEKVPPVWAAWWGPEAEPGQAGAEASPGQESSVESLGTSKVAS